MQFVIIFGETAGFLYAVVIPKKLKSNKRAFFEGGNKLSTMHIIYIPQMCEIC